MPPQPDMNAATAPLLGELKQYLDGLVSRLQTPREFAATKVNTVRFGVGETFAEGQTIFACGLHPDHVVHRYNVYSCYAAVGVPDPMVYSIELTRGAQRVFWVPALGIGGANGQIALAGGYSHANHDTYPGQVQDYDNAVGAVTRIDLFPIYARADRLVIKSNVAVTLAAPLRIVCISQPIPR
jgi:hypothetical protein